MVILFISGTKRTEKKSFSDQHVKPLSKKKKKV